jgi:hypothetical protein
MQLAREIRRVLARERDAQRVGSPGGVARGEDALERRSTGGERALQRALPLGDAGGLGAQRPALGRERRERAVGLRDGALR